MREKDSKHKLLIIDDILGNIKILIEILNPLYEIAFVTSGSQAVDTALLEKPDLILLDIMMPDVDGFEVCKRLKADAVLKEIPIIFLSALDETESVVKGFDLGAVDYVTKPYHPSELLTRIETHLKLKESREIIERKNKELAELFQILCHDFMTPVSFVLGSLELIRHDPSSYNTFEPHIYNSLRNAADLIDLVRTLRKLDDFDQRLTLIPVRLSEAVNKASILLQHKLRNKSIKLDVSIDQNLVVKAEETSLINSVINNLLTNAIKFSYPDSQIKVTGFEENGRVVLEFKDNGVGMSKTMLRDLFIITRATSRKGTEGEVGTGYGMLLIKKFLGLYNAEMFIESKDKESHPKDHGTTTRISFEKG